MNSASSRSRPGLRAGRPWRGLPATATLALLARWLCAPLAVEAQQTVPDFKLVRELSIDAAINDLSPIGWLAVGLGGTMAIGQPQDFQVRFFSAAGKATAVVGRKGQGPGEFGAMTLHGWLGDTLWVGDMETRRLTLIETTGRVARSQLWPQGVRFRAGTAGPLPSFIFAVPWALYADGTVLSFAYRANEAVPGWMRRPPRGFQPFVRTRADGLFESVVAWTHEPNQECYVNAPAGRSSRPLCFQPLWAVSRSGATVMVVSIERSDPATDVVRVHAVTADADTLFDRPLIVPRVRIPRSVADSIRGLLARMRQRSGQPPSPVADLPETFPPFQTTIIGRDTTVWLESGVTTGDRVWLVLDQRGRSLGTVRVPRNVELRVVSLGRVWATERDSDGLEGVTVYRVQR